MAAHNIELSGSSDKNISSSTGPALPSFPKPHDERDKAYMAPVKKWVDYFVERRTGLKGAYYALEFAAGPEGKSLKDCFDEGRYAEIFEYRTNLPFSGAMWW